MGSVFYLHFAVSRGRCAQKVYQLEKLLVSHSKLHRSVTLHVSVSRSPVWASEVVLNSGSHAWWQWNGRWHARPWWLSRNTIDISWHFNVTCSHVHPHWTDLGRYWCGNDNQWWDRVGNCATFLFLQTLQKCQNTTWGWGVNESLACIFPQAEGTTITTSTSTSSRVSFFQRGLTNYFWPFFVRLIITSRGFVRMIYFRTQKKWPNRMQYILGVPWCRGPAVAVRDPPGDHAAKSVKCATAVLQWMRCTTPVKEQGRKGRKWAERRS